MVKVWLGNKAILVFSWMRREPPLWGDLKWSLGGSGPLRFSLAPFSLSLSLTLLLRWLFALCFTCIQNPQPFCVYITSIHKSKLSITITGLVPHKLKKNPIPSHQSYNIYIYMSLTCDVRTNKINRKIN